MILLFLRTTQQHFYIKHHLWVNELKRNENSWTYVINCRKCQNTTNTTRAYLLLFVLIKLHVIVPTAINHHTYQHYPSLLDSMWLSSIPMLRFGLPITSFIAASSYIFHLSAFTIFNSINNITITTCYHQNHLLSHTRIIYPDCVHELPLNLKKWCPRSRTTKRLRK